MWHIYRIAAGSALVKATGSPRAAHAALVAFARARTDHPDAAFSEKAILDQTVRNLLAR